MDARYRRASVYSNDGTKPAQYPAYPDRLSANNGFHRETEALEEFAKSRHNSYNAKVVQLENNLRYLRAENARIASRQQPHDQLPATSPERMLQLKQRNAELESAANQLESKAKASRVIDEDMHPSRQSLIDLRREYDQRRARDLAENARQLADKERELERLRRHYDGLVYTTKNSAGENEAMERMLKTAQRERLTLQHQLSWNENFFSDEPTADRLARLTDEISNVEKTRRDLEAELRRLKESAVRVRYMRNGVQEKAAEGGEAPDGHARSARHRNQASTAASAVAAASLAQAFKGVGRDLERSRRETESLKQHMTELELIMKHMRESLERKFQMEQDGSRLKLLIDRKSREFLYSKKPADQKALKGNQETMENLRSQLRELEKQTEMQSFHHDELLLELEAAKKRQKYDEIRQLGIAISESPAPSATSATVAAFSTAAATRPNGQARANVDFDNGADYRIPWTDGTVLDGALSDALLDSGDFFAEQGDHGSGGAAPVNSAVTKLLEQYQLPNDDPMDSKAR